MPVIFISYAHDDGADRAKEIENKLRESSRTWRDQPDIQLSAKWTLEIQQALDDTFALLLICTEQSNKSSFVTFEWAYAFGLGLERVGIIPIYDVIDDVPAILRDNNVQGLKYGRSDFWETLQSTLQNLHMNSFHHIYIPREAKGYLRELAFHAFAPLSPTRTEAIRQLSTYEDPIAQDILINGLSSPQPEIRLEIIEAMHRVKFSNPKAIPRLRELLLTSEYQRTRNTIASVLSNMGEDVIETLAQDAATCHVTVLGEVLAVLRDTNNPKAIPYLVEALKAQDPERQVTAIRTFSFINKYLPLNSEYKEFLLKAITPVLIEVVETCPNDDQATYNVLMAGLQWLQSIGTHSANAYLAQRRAKGLPI